MKNLQNVLALNSQIKMDSTRLTAMKSIYDYANVLANIFQNESCDKYGFGYWYNPSLSKLSRIYTKIVKLERKIELMKKELLAFVLEA